MRQRAKVAKTHDALEGAPGNRLAHEALQLQSFSQKFPSAMHEQLPTLQLPSQLHGLNCAQTCKANNNHK